MPISDKENALEFNVDDHHNDVTPPALTMLQAIVRPDGTYFSCPTQHRQLNVLSHHTNVLRRLFRRRIIG